MLALLIISWVLFSIVTFGFTFAYFMWAHPNRDVGFAKSFTQLMATFGPFAFLGAVAAFGTDLFRHGFRIR